jgi:hypothetical protein
MPILILGHWVVCRVFYVLEFHISEGVVPDSILEPVGLKVLGERCNLVLLEVCMLIMLLNVKIHVFVKIEVLAVSLISEGLQLGANGVPG